MVENAILQQTFVWPSLTIEAADGQVSYCSLPVTVEVHFPHTRDHDASAEERPIRSNGIIYCDDWEQSVAKARLAAADLWAYKHASWRYDFQKLIRDTSVILDVRTAEAIASPYRGQHFHLDGESLEVYIALTILGHLIDPAAMDTTCATGILRSRRDNGSGDDRHKKGKDWSIGQVDDLDAKIDGVLQTYVVDNYIIPGDPEHIPGYFKLSPGRRRHRLDKPITRNRGHLRVSQRRLFSEYADEAFGQYWHRHRYKACPDQEYAFRTEPTEPWICNQAFDVVKILRENTKPVLTLNYAPEVVSRALYEIQAAAADKRDDRSEPNERVGHFAFIRAVSNERYDRFWHSLWHLFGWPMFPEGTVGELPIDFETFRFIVSPERASSILSAHLNWFHPTPTKPRRAPDVLVIIGARNLSHWRERIPLGPFSRLSPASIFRSLGDKLDPSSNPAIATLIGRTRVILVPDDSEPPTENEINSELEAEVRDAFNKLSIFRHGFSYQMARSLLAGSDDDFNKIMTKLTHTSFEGGDLMEYGNTSGEYFLRARARLPEERRVRADLHLMAADAIVGFLAKGKVNRLEFRQGLAPAHVHEAQWHLEQAWELRDAGGSMHAKSALERLSRIGEIFGPSRLRWSVECSNEDGPEFLDAMLQHLHIRKRKCWLIHPIEYVLLAKLAFALQKRNSISRDHGKTLRDELFEDALQVCEKHFDELGEGSACRFVIATSRACITMAETPDARGLERARFDIETALRLEKSAIEILDPEWFEFMGDAQDNPDAAIRFYRQGFSDEGLAGVGVRHQTVVKYLGACVLASIAPPCDILERIRQTVPRRVTGPIFRADSDTGLWTFEHVRQRWYLGRPALEQLFSTGDLANG
jgi:hypothetical protein